MDVTSVLSLTGIFMLVSAALVYRLPVGRCRECPHCLAEDRRAAEEQHRLQVDVDRRWGVPHRCPHCGGKHDRDDGP